MKTFQILISMDFGSTSFGDMKSVLETFKKGKYSLVGEVEVADIYDTYAKTQNVTSSWIAGNGVRVLPEGKELVEENGGVRSLSVGDIVRDSDDQQLYLVDHDGFTPVTSPTL